DEAAGLHEIGHEPRTFAPCRARREMMMRARFLVIAGAVLALTTSTALEAAAQAQPIIGCVKPGTGLLRIPPPGEGCKANETPLGFNDLPLLVALRTQVEQLVETVTNLEERLAILEACIAVNIPACSAD